MQFSFDRINRSPVVNHTRAFHFLRSKWFLCIVHWLHWLIAFSVHGCVPEFGIHSIKPHGHVQNSILGQVTPNSCPSKLHCSMQDWFSGCVREASFHPRGLQCASRQEGTYLRLLTCGWQTDPKLGFGMNIWFGHCAACLFCKTTRRVWTLGNWYRIFLTQVAPKPKGVQAWTNGFSKWYYIIAQK